MNRIAICLLLTLQFLFQVDAFLFALKSVGTKLVTAAPGDIITYNAHITISHATPLSFYVNLPYHVTPIFNVEKIDVIGIGANLEASTRVVTYSKEDTSSLLRSQASIDFGNASRLSSVRAVSSGDKVVVQVQSRLLKHTNVTSGAKFWLYFGMEYQNESIWIIGKSVQVDIQTGPARLGVKLFIQTGQTPTKTGVEFTVHIYHLLDSKSPATNVTVTLSMPSYLTYQSSSKIPPLDASINNEGNTIKVELNQPLEVGEHLEVNIVSTTSLTEQGEFVYANIYGGFKYDTTDENHCAKTIEQKETLHLPIKIYANKDVCDDDITSANSVTVGASSAVLPCCGPEQAVSDAVTDGWQPWGNSTVRLADDFIQVNFGKTTTLSRIRIGGRDHKFVKTFYMSYSQDGVFWKYVLHFGKPKEFEANKDSLSKLLILMEPAIVALSVRIHPQKQSPTGAAIRLRMYGCQNGAAPTYNVYQRSFIAATGNILILCSVHPDRRKAKTNCFGSYDGGSRWEAFHPQVVNVIGFDPVSAKIYGLGMTTAGNDVYMELQTPQAVRLITKGTWTSIKDGGGLVLPTIIPLSPVRGDPMYQLSGTSTTVDGVTYAEIVRKSCDYAVGSFALLSLASWEISSYRSYRERERIKKAVNLLNEYENKRAQGLESESTET